MRVLQLGIWFPGPNWRVIRLKLKCMFSVVYIKTALEHSLLSLELGFHWRNVWENVAEDRYSSFYPWWRGS